MRYNYEMDHISAHINGTVPPTKRAKATGKDARDRATERGELMQFFMDRLNDGRGKAHLPKLTMPRMGRLLEAVPTKDLYYLQTVCLQSKDFSKKFWWEINPKNHTPEAKAKAEKKWKEIKESKKLEDKKQKYRDMYNNL
jgi:hypothetical protein